MHPVHNDFLPYALADRFTPLKQVHADRCSHHFEVSCLYKSIHESVRVMRNSPEFDLRVGIVQHKTDLLVGDTFRCGFSPKGTRLDVIELKPLDVAALDEGVPCSIQKEAVARTFCKSPFPQSIR